MTKFVNIPDDDGPLTDLAKRFRTVWPDGAGEFLPRQQCLACGAVMSVYTEMAAHECAAVPVIAVKPKETR